MTRSNLLATFAVLALFAASFVGSLGCTQPAQNTAGPTPAYTPQAGYSQQSPPVTSPGYQYAAPTAAAVPPGRGHGHTVYVVKSTSHMASSTPNYPTYPGQGHGAPNQGSHYTQPGPGVMPSNNPSNMGHGRTLRVYKNTSHMNY